MALPPQPSNSPPPSHYNVGNGVVNFKPINLNGSNLFNGQNPMTSSDPLSSFNRQRFNRFRTSSTPPAFNSKKVSYGAEDEKESRNRNHRMYHSHPNVKIKKKRKYKSKPKKTSKKKVKPAKSPSKKRNTGNHNENDEMKRNKELMNRKMKEYFGEEEEEEEEDSEVEDDNDGHHHSSTHSRSFSSPPYPSSKNIPKQEQGEDDSDDERGNRKSTHLNTLQMKQPQPTKKNKKTVHLNTFEFKKKGNGKSFLKEIEDEMKKKEDPRFKIKYEQHHLYRDIIAYDMCYSYQKSRIEEEISMNSPSTKKNELQKKIDVDSDDDLEDVFASHDQNYMREIMRNKNKRR